MMHTVILVIHIIATLLLIGIILLQRSDSDGLGIGGGATGGLVTGRAQANFLTRTTAILATIFIMTSLGLTIFSDVRTKSSIIDQLEAGGTNEPTSAVPVAPANPAMPEIPAVPKPE